MSSRERSISEPNFKALQYESKGDVEYLIPRFEEVVKANGWRLTAAVLHILEVWKMMLKAVDDYWLCADIGSPRSTIWHFTDGGMDKVKHHAQGIIVVLAWTCFRSQVTSRVGMRRIAIRISKLYDGRNLLQYCRQCWLQWHLLVMKTHTIEAAVWAHNRFLHITHWW